MLTRPRHFISLLDRAVRPSDFEIVDVSLRSVLADISVGTSHLRASFAAFRDAKTNEQRLDCVRSIRRGLARREVAPTHAVVAALAARILRHGSSEATDEALALLAQQWERAEQRLGVELETSVFAYTQRDRADYDALLERPADQTCNCSGFVRRLLFALGTRVARARRGVTRLLSIPRISPYGPACARPLPLVDCTCDRRTAPRIGVSKSMSSCAGEASRSSRPTAVKALRAPFEK